MVGREYLGIAEIFSDRPITREQVSAWLNCVADLPPDLIVQALRKYARDTKATRPPTPGQIRELVNPQMDSRSEAVEASSRVVAAVTKFGMYQGAAAREWIGELGWAAVERIGGWKYLCEYQGTKTLPVTTVQAQIRDACEAMHKRARAGQQAIAPGIPKAELEASAVEVMRVIEQKQQPKKEGENE